MSKVEEIYDNHIWKELEKEDAIPPEVNSLLGQKILCFHFLLSNIQLYATLQVYLNALGLFLRLDVRDVLDGFKDRLELLAAQVSHALVG